MSFSRIIQILVLFFPRLLDAKYENGKLTFY